MHKRVAIITAISACAVALTALAIYKREQLMSDFNKAIELVGHKK